MVDQTQEQTDTLEAVDELSLLKERAKMLGVTFSNNISVETLRAKINAKLAGEVDKPEAPALTDPDNPEAAPPTNKPETVQQLRERLFSEQMKLVRVRITNLDPKKKELPGEIFTVANEYIGTVRKYIPYGEVTDEGYHIPFCIYQNLLERKFLDIRTSKDRQNPGQIRIQQTWAQEFAIEVLPQLKPEELKKLAQAQLAAGNV